jgi:hypothetical protein
MALTKKQQELAEALKDAETLHELRAVVDTMEPKDKQALGPNIHAATEKIVRLTKGF